MERVLTTLGAIIEGSVSIAPHTRLTLTPQTRARLSRFYTAPWPTRAVCLSRTCPPYAATARTQCG